MSKSDKPSVDIRRLMVLVIGVASMIVWAFLRWNYGTEGSTKFATAATGRIGLVLIALWLAWDSLQRPARWLPPGFAMALVVGLCILAARPRLIIVVIPALGILLTVSVFVRMFKR